jgi:hypothetical protein
MLLLYTGVYIMIQYLVGWGDRDVVTLHWGMNYDTDI